MPDKTSTPPEYSCKECGVKFIRKHAYGKYAPAFCSTECFVNNRRITTEKFWSFVVKKENGCWEWNGYFNFKGYGQIRINQKSVMAHRHAWFLTNGSIPKGLLVCHHCDNPPCCNPAHLFLGTEKINTHDAVSKGRMCRGEGKRNAKLKESQVIEILRLYYLEGIPTRKIERMMNLKMDSLGSIVTGMNWGYLQPSTAKWRRATPDSPLCFQFDSCGNALREH